MKERPILFSAPMVRALRAGTKTQTRRALRVQPPAETANFCTYHHPDPRQHHWALDGGSLLDFAVPCPYGQPGDRLWVRETWMECGLTRRGLAKAAFYAADGGTYYDPTTSPPTQRKWRPSIHMPRWASRIDLEVTGVRVERLQDISEADAWAEGCARGQADDVGGFFPAEEPLQNGKGVRGWDNARDWYADLWEAINGEGSWDANPWVWVVEFKRIKPSIGEPRNADVLLQLANVESETP